MGKFPSLNECDPGLDPTEYNVLILPEPVEEIRASGLILIDKTTEADKYAQVRGMLVAASPLAFSYAVWPENAHRGPPTPGEIVFFAKYAGTQVTGSDGREYRLIKDQEIAAIIREKSAA